MFLWLNVFFFFAGYQAVLPQAKYNAGNYYWPHIQNRVLAKAASKNIDKVDFVREYNKHLVSVEKYLFFVAIPVFAFVTFLFYIYQRNNFYVKHFVYSIHFWCYFFIFFAFVPEILSGLNSLINWATGFRIIRSYDGMVFGIILYLCIIPYTFFALKRVFGENLLLTILKTVLVTILVMQVRVWGIGFCYYVAYLIT